MSRPVTASTVLSGKFRQNIAVGPHTLIGDESKEAGGDDAGPDPHEYLLAALATCTSMTVKMYADRKGWPLRSVRVDVVGARKDETYAISRTIHLDGDLDTDQRARVLEMANKCPVTDAHGRVEIASDLAELNATLRRLHACTPIRRTSPDTSRLIGRRGRQR
jgi:putative redox protein